MILAFLYFCHSSFPIAPVRLISKPCRSWHIFVNPDIQWFCHGKIDKLAFSPCSIKCITLLCLFLTIQLSHPKLNLCVHQALAPHSFPTRPMAATVLLSISVNITNVSTLPKRNYATFAFSWVVYFTWHSISKVIHIVVYIGSFTFLAGECFILYIQYILFSLHLLMDFYFASVFVCCR